MPLAIIGQRFHRLIVVADAGVRGRNRHRYLECRCDCGNTSTVRMDGLKANRVWSCGCYQLERFKTHPHRLKHGHARQSGVSPEYKAWQAMKKRCFCVSSDDYLDYGARGITVAPEWIDDFEAFFEHVGRKPSAKHSIDRINNNGNYEPGNVKWSTNIEQANNRRPHRRHGVRASLRLQNQALRQLSSQE